MQTGDAGVDGDRPERDLPGGTLDPRSDLLLYRPPQVPPVPPGAEDDIVTLYVHAGPRGRATYYLSCRPMGTGRDRIWLLESRLEAAAFILGSEHKELSRLDGPDRERIRAHFPEYFG